MLIKYDDYGEATATVHDLVERKLTDTGYYSRGCQETSDTARNLVDFLTNLVVKLAKLGVLSEDAILDLLGLRPYKED